MTSERRNPYLVLGLPYGASRSEATVAFARRSKRARSDPSFRYETEDLTWALNQVEAVITSAVSDVDIYRVPADPAVFLAPEGPGVLRPGPVPIPRRTSAPEEDELAALRKAALLEELVDLVIDDAAEVVGAYGLDREVAPNALTATSTGRRWFG